MTEGKTFYVKGNKIMQRQDGKDVDVTAIFPSICYGAMSEEDRYAKRMEMSNQLKEMHKRN